MALLSQRSPDRGSDSGQAAVESALVLPLVVFLIFGILQLSLMLQARVLAHYAAFKAVRTGSVSHADCDRMLHAAIATLIPAIRPFTAPGTPGGTPGQKLAEQFRIRRNNSYQPSVDEGRNGAVVWLYRERPVKAAVDAMPDTEDLQWDVPGRPLTPADLSRLEVRMIFWYPLRIPFANWVMARMYQAHLGLGGYTAIDPLTPVNQANWTANTTYALAADVAGELAMRTTNREYVFPIEASYTMRMMTPVKKSRFVTQHCPPLP